MSARWYAWMPVGLLVWLAFFSDKPAGSRSTGVVEPAPGASGKPAFGPAPEATAVSAGPQIELVLRPRPGQQVRAGLEAKRREDSRDLFAARSWNPPPPPPPPAAPAPPPVAPALPFTFLGKKLESDSWEVYLGRGEETFVVREGQVLENTYRVERIAPPELSLTYLPLKQLQSMSIGGSH